MRALLSVLFLLTISLGAMEAPLGPVSDPVPATETHAPGSQDEPRRPPFLVRALRTQLPVS